MIPSPGVPLSVCSANVGAAGAVVSSMKLSVSELPEVLPAASVCRAITFFKPSPLSVKLVPFPLIQCAPPSVLYCHGAPLASPLTSTRPTFVIPSPVVPLSV